MKNIPLILFLFLYCGHSWADIQLHCKGKVNIFTDIDGEIREFRGELVWDLDGGSNNYLSFSGYYLAKGNPYPINRAVRANVSLISGSKNIYEITPIRTTVLQSVDGLPPELEATFMFKQTRVYRIQKTLVNSYLISNAYSPVFVCHSF